MKRGKNLLLVLLALLLCSTGCGTTDTGDETGTTDTESEETLTEPADTTVQDDLPEKDFGGADMQILTSTWRTITTYIYAEEETGEVINDALFAQRANVEDRFNVRSI